MRRAFTLVELLIVIIIVAVLAAIAVPKFVSRTLHSREVTIRRTLEILRSATERFHADTGLYPAQLSDLASSSAPTRGLTKAGLSQALEAQNFKGPYVDRIPVSPVTNQAYLLVLPAVDNKIIHHPAGRASDGSSYYTW